MALFEFEDGRLIPAQFGRPVSGGLTPELVDAICGQVLEIVSRPLFPITWRDVSRGPKDAADSPRLTSLDATGQVVSVEVVARLDSDTLISSLSRLADTASLSWTDLAREYEGGIDAFKAGWLAFRDSMPPSPGAGPRLVMVVGSIDPQVRPALDVLATSGVEVHEVSMRRMSNGRTFLEVLAVGPRLYGHAPQVLLGQSGQVPELSARPRSIDEGGAGARPAGDVEAPSSVEPADEPARSGGDGSTGGASADEDALVDAPSASAATIEPAESADGALSAAPGVEPPVEGPAVAETSPEEPSAAQPDAQEDERPSLASDRPWESEEVAAARAAGVPVLGRDEQSLVTLAMIIGDEVPLVSHPDCDAPLGLVLGKDGAIRADSGTWTTPTALEEVAPALADAWEHLRIADLAGPSLAESIDEVNREMIREYSAAPPRRSAGRHGRA